MSIKRQSARWSWSTCTVFAEESGGQVWLTFAETTAQVRLSADPDAVCPPWMGPAASPARALVSTSTREKLAVTRGVHIPDRVFDVTAQAIQIFEQSLKNVPGRSLSTDRELG
ncbi:hypothetical protein [Rhodococcus erythropolis]|uniref:hypothetical protein n=1 Tax=Rhodococcus erythropolis TaxID=1833 RepID=UPI00114CBAAE|nr:hypothetical protein [Rhodococcus erythropolis]